MGVNMFNPLMKEEVIKKAVKKFGSKKPEVKEKYTCSSGKCICKDCKECDSLLVNEIEKEGRKLKDWR